MTLSIPYTSLEVRWFFPGSLRKQPELINWFERESPLPSAKDLASPTWRSRQNDEPDRYLLLPGKDDMGIKWREGSFQVKGLVSRLGVQRFAGRHTGLVEHWIKWSYAGLPEAYAELFDGQHPDLRTVAVHKIRALRRIRLDSFSGKMVEVSEEEELDRGVGVELTDLTVEGWGSFYSLAFEAFPVDAGLPAAFTRAVEIFLDSLPVTLEATNSRSYPAWLHEVIGS